MAKCLYCYKELNGNERDFHKACSKKIFGTLEVPILPYTHNNLNDLARQVIRSQTTLTGVQAKLSLDINKGSKNEPGRFTIVGLWGALYFEAANRTVRQSSRIRGSDNASCGDSQDTSCAA